MRTSNCGLLGNISCLALGGGGIGQVWGKTNREEAIATIKEAIAHGITLLDMAPIYGKNREAERLIGRVFEGQLPDNVRILTKYYLANPPLVEVEKKIRRSLQKSLSAMRLEKIDMFVLHSNIVPDDWIPPLPSNLKNADRIFTRWNTYVNGWIPTMHKLKKEGLIKAWGITGIGEPKTILKALQHTPKPQIVQVVANCLDTLGSMKRFAGPAMPRDIIRIARRNNIPVLGIRAVAAGSLCDTMDRSLAMDVPEQLDWYKAHRFRKLSKELGVSAAILAHRYSLSMGASSVVLGVKNRVELAECLHAAKLGPLSDDTIALIDKTLAHAKL